MTGDPIIFLDEVRKRTEDMGCSDRRAIQMAGFSLTGVASQWYQDYIRPHVTDMTWDQFRTRFERQFIPFSVREEHRVRFETLQRGDMSVSEYTRLFIQLSRYAPHSIAFEELKVSRYIAGLGPEFVLLRQLFEHTFLQVADVAKQMEIDLRSHGIIIDGDRKKKNKVEA